MSAFPSALATFLGFTGSHTLSVDQHASQHNSEQAEIIATQTKMGTGTSTPTPGTVLRGNGTGTSTWGQVDLKHDVTGILPLANGGTGGVDAPTALASLGGASLAQVYPVGCIYTETTGTNPSSTFGFGTWIAFGGGRVLVGNGTSDAAYAAGATGGESTHVLTIPEMPSHTHDLPTTALVLSGGANNTPNNADNATPRVASLATGGGGSHNNLQPYIVVFFWRRAA